MFASKMHQGELSRIVYTYAEESMREIVYNEGLPPCGLQHDKRAEGLVGYSGEEVGLHV